jgi:hypothetical protein
MKKQLLIFTIIVFLGNFATGQGKTLQFDSIFYDQYLSDRIFITKDSAFDDIYNKKIAINAACVTNNFDTLYACDCYMTGDTILIDISARIGDIFIDQYIKINKNKFTTFNKEIEPIGLSPYLSYPIKQKLILQSDKFTLGELINGYIDFEGKGNYSKQQIKYMKEAFGKENGFTKEQIKQGFNRTVKGYFKCKLVKE